jgi:GNAT superfamily N-acetyltransferase
MRNATLNDIALLLELMTEFYAESNYELDRENATQAFRTILEQPRLGDIFIIDFDGQGVGHAVITYKFAMEYGGMMACLDDLFIRPEFRNRGLSTAALEKIRQYCRQHQIRAMTVEVAFDNAPAQKVYRRTGFKELENRQLLGMELLKPADGA